MRGRDESGQGVGEKGSGGKRRGGGSNWGSRVAGVGNECGLRSNVSSGKDLAKDDLLAPHLGSPRLLRFRR